MPVSNAMPTAAPTNSARSVAMAASSLMSHIARAAGAGKCARHSCARFCPVTMPSRADSAWNSIATTLAATTTHSSW